MQTLNKYQDHLILDLDKIPNHPHHVVMAFDTITLTDDRGSAKIQSIGYYAFTSEAEWRTMIQEFTLEQIHTTSQKPKIAFFHSGGAGRVELKVQVGLG